jgi:hypothetical protein
MNCTCCKVDFNCQPPGGLKLFLVGAEQSSQASIKYLSFSSLFVSFLVLSQKAYIVEVIAVNLVLLAHHGDEL